MSERPEFHCPQCTSHFTPNGWPLQNWLPFCSQECKDRAKDHAQYIGNQMPDTLDLDLDALKAPENRDRVMQVERLLRAIAYSEELDSQTGKDEDQPLNSSWRIAPGTKITLRRVDPTEEPVPGYTTAPFAGRVSPRARVILDHQNERAGPPRERVETEEPAPAPEPPPAA